ncbi:MAG: hypothetical protein Q7T79_03990 [bacterium]|nr:hypothetical protein [bacterium]
MENVKKWKNLVLPILIIAATMIFCTKISKAEELEKVPLIEKEIFVATTTITPVPVVVPEKATATLSLPFRKKMLAEELVKSGKIKIMNGEKLENVQFVVLVFLDELTKKFPKEIVEIFSMKRKPLGGGSLHNSSTEEKGAVDFVFDGKSVKETQRILYNNELKYSGIKILEFFGPKLTLNSWVSNGPRIASQHWNHIHIGIKIVEKKEVK